MSFQVPQIGSFRSRIGGLTPRRNGRGDRCATDEVVDVHVPHRADIGRLVLAEQRREPARLQVRAAASKVRPASPRNTATVGPNFTRMDPRHSPSPWSGASGAPGMHDATSAGSRSNGQTSAAGSGIVVFSG
jgi:hypothetical protein